MVLTEILKKKTFIFFAIQLLLVISVNFILVNQSYCEMSVLTDTELEEVTAQAGFSSFTRTNFNGMIRMDLTLDIKIETIVNLKEMKLGHWVNNSEPRGLDLPWYLGGRNFGVDGTDWDIDFTNMQMGRRAGDAFGNTSNEPFVMDGLIFRADFTETANGKRLEQFLIGTHNANGLVYAQDMSVYSGGLNVKLSEVDIAIISSIVKSILDSEWVYRSNVLNDPGGLIGSTVGDVAQAGVKYGQGNPSQLYIAFNRNKGVGMFSGFPITKIDEWD